MTAQGLTIVAVTPEDVAQGPVHAARTASLLRGSGDVRSRAVLVDLRAVDAWAKPVHAYADSLCAWLAEGLPERLIVLGTAVPLEKRLEGTAASLLALHGLDARRALWLVEHQDDLVTDLPEHSPLDAALFEEFMQHEKL